MLKEVKQDTKRKAKQDTDSCLQSPYCLPHVYVSTAVESIHWGNTFPQLWKGTMEESAIAEHVWTINHTAEWNEMTMLDQERRRKELMIKEA